MGIRREAIQYYNKNAEKFFRESLDADTAKVRRNFTSRLPCGGHILDLGCGGGRDSLAFLEEGFEVTAMDASRELCRMAEEYTGLPVLCRDMTDGLPEGRFDGVWACASLVHLDDRELFDVLRAISFSLKPGGKLFVSFRYGTGMNYVGERRFNDMDEARFSALIRELGGLYIDEMLVGVDPSRPEGARWLAVFLTNTLYYY